MSYKITEHKDFLGQEIKIGDNVICSSSGCRKLYKAIVVELKKVMIRVITNDHGVDYTRIVHPSSIVVINDIVNK